MALGRIIRWVKGEHLSIIRIDRLTRIFVTGDLLSLSVQGGAANLTTDKKTEKIGEYMVVAGLLVQIILLGLLFVTAITFHCRLRKQPTRQSYTTEAPWKQTLYMVYTVSTLIFARSIFRVVEYAQGQDGYSLTHEWTLYVFDAVPMFVVAVVFWIWYPRCIPSAIEDVEAAELDSSSKGNRGRSGGSG